MEESNETTNPETSEVVGTGFHAAADGADPTTQIVPLAGGQPGPSSFTFPSFESLDAVSPRAVEGTGGGFAAAAAAAAAAAVGGPMPLSMPAFPPAPAGDLAGASGDPTPPYGTPPLGVTAPVDAAADWVPWGSGAPGGVAAGSSPGGPGGGPGGPVPLGEGSPGSPRSHGRRSLAAAVAGVALLAGGLGAGIGAAFGSNGTSNTSNTSSSALSGGGSASSGLGGSSGASGTTLPSRTTSGANLVQRVANAVDPSVVDINTTVASPQGQGLTQAAGTGMIVSSSGLVVTNNHVVDQATSIRVTIAGRSGSFPAKVLGVDPVHDVALIQIQGVSGLPTISFGDSSSVAVGDTVVAVGNALGQGGTPTVVSGAVSATGRTITAGDAGTSVTETLHNLIQTNAPIQPGDSGGPLVNTSGQVIGMDTAAASGDTGTTLGFAIPINQARSIAANIEQGKAGNGVILGESAYLGIYEVPSGSTGSTVSPFGGAGGSGGFSGNSGTPGASGSSSSSTPAKGVYVSAVTQGGPAAAAGLQSGDTITSIDGNATTGFAALKAQISSRQPGDSVTVTYLDASGASHSVQVTLGGIPA